MQSPNNSLGILETSKFALFTISWFFCSIFLYPIEGEPSIFYLNTIGAALCVVFAFKDVWVAHDHQTRVQLYLWYSILFLTLPFIAAFVLIRSEFNVAWVVYFVLSIILLRLTVRNKPVFYTILAIGSFFGFGFGLAFNLYAQPFATSAFTDFALYSCGFFILRITLAIHDRIFVDRHVYQLVEKEVRDRTKELSEALEVKNEFLDNIGHEIKIPVHNITNMISELCDNWHNTSDEDKLALAQMLKKSNARLMSLCSNLVDLSKSAQCAALEIKKCDLMLLLDETLAEYKPFRRLISSSISPGVVPFVYCDEGQILQVLRNLLDNATKYAKGSPIKIAINNRSEDIIFSVADEGVGIPEQELASIFKPFEQSSRTKTRAGGTGLGLAICKKIIECHKGKIWAENNEKKGVTFFFTIPK